MNAPTSKRVLAVIMRVKGERERAMRKRLADDIAVLDEELHDLRLALLKLLWKERTHANG